jgi:uncharacterized protein (UPF0276 family)
MPVRGVGLGLRREIFDELLERRPPEIDFLEVSPENFMRRGGAYPAALRDAAATYPVVTHGLSMSLGGTDPLDARYLAELRAFVHDVASPWHSDHLCFGSVGGRVLHDLLPIAFKADAVARVADRIRRAEDALGVPVAVENITYYMHPGKKEMEEPEFLSRVCDAAGCGLMLDVNNAYVNATNFGFDVDAWMRAAPLERVVQIHVAGHEAFDLEGERILVDTHGADVPDPVLALLERVLRRTGDVPILLERDNNVPGVDELLREVAALRRIRDRAVAAA